MVPLRLMTGMIVALCLVSLVSCGSEENVSGPDNLTPRAEILVQRLSEEDFDGARTHFDSTMQQALPAQGLREAWTALTRQLGTYQGQASTRTAREQGFDVVYITCSFQNGSVDVKVAFDQHGKVSGLWFVNSTPA